MHSHSILCISLLICLAIFPVSEAGLGASIRYGNFTQSNFINAYPDCPDELGDLGSFLPTDTCVQFTPSSLLSPVGEITPVAFKLTCSANAQLADSTDLHIAAYMDASCSTPLSDIFPTMNFRNKKCFNPVPYNPSGINPALILLSLDCSAPDAMPSFLTKKPLLNIDMIGALESEMASLPPQFRPNPNATIPEVTCPGGALTKTRIGIIIPASQQMQCPPPGFPTGIPTPQPVPAAAQQTVHASVSSVSSSTSSPQVSALIGKRVHHTLAHIFASVAAPGSQFQRAHQEMIQLVHLQSTSNADPIPFPDIPAPNSMYNLEFSFGAGAKMTICLPSVSIDPNTHQVSFSFPTQEIKFDRSTSCELSSFDLALSMFTLHMKVPYQILNNGALSVGAIIGIVVAVVAVAAAAVAFFGFRKGYFSCCGRRATDASSEGALNGDAHYSSLDNYSSSAQRYHV